jgi:hypothetical protein
MAQVPHIAYRFLFLRRSCRLQSVTRRAVLPADLMGAYHQERPNVSVVVFATYWAEMASFGYLFATYWASYVPFIGPKQTYTHAYCAKPH